MAIRETTFTSLPQEERIRVSSSGLISIRFDDGRYLFSLGEHEEPQAKPKVRPLGGAWQRTDSLQWEKTSFIPDPKAGTDLRGTVFASSLAQYSELLRSGRGREINPVRELYEELGMPLGLTEEQVRADFDIILQGSKSFRAPSASGSLTQYNFEIYEASVENPLVKTQIVEAVANGNVPFCFLTQKQILYWLRTTEPPLVSRGGNLITVDMAPTCPLVLQNKQFDTPLRQPTRYSLEQSLENLSIRLEEFTQRHSHRLAEEDFRQLRQCGDPKLVDDMARTLGILRSLTDLVNHFIGPFSEGLTVFAGSAPDAYKISLLIAGFGGMLLRDALSTAPSKKASGLLLKNLTSILHGIYNETEPDRIIGAEKNIGGIVNNLANAELATSPSNATISSTVSVASALTLQGMPAEASAFTGFMALGEFTVYKMLQKWSDKDPSLLKQALPHFLAAVLRYSPAIIANLDLNLEKIAPLVTAYAIGGSTLASHYNYYEEIAGGKQGKRDLKAWLSKIHFSLTPKNWQEHSLAILSREDTGIVTGSPENGKNIKRYQLLNHAAKELGLSQSEINRPTKPLVLVNNFTLPVPGRPEIIILNEAQIAMGPGIHIFKKGKYGPKLALAALAGVVRHPTGTVLMRLPETDINLHGLSREESAHLVQFTNAERENLRLEYLEYLEPASLIKSGLFTEEEISRYLRGETLGLDFRNKYSLVQALSANVTPWTLLYMNIHKDTESHTLEQMSRYLSQHAQDRIICLGLRSSPGIPEELFAGLAPFHSYTIKDRNFVLDY